MWLEISPSDIALTLSQPGTTGFAFSSSESGRLREKEQFRGEEYRTAWAWSQTDLGHSWSSATTTWLEPPALSKSQLHSLYNEGDNY